jgi:transcriptional regulator with XRE-family HTH domain
MPDLGAFLRQRRERLTPFEVGMPSGIGRRTPGLRRQEVAQLAGISIDYYIKLEQGRGSVPSPQVLAALSRALMLSQEERDYLVRLAGGVAAPMDGPTTSVSAPLRFLVENMPEVPAYVVDATWNLLAWNELATFFIGELVAMPEDDRNLARWLFRTPPDDPHWTDPSTMAFAQIVVADLRSCFLQFPHYTPVIGLKDELSGVSTLFRELWDARPLRRSAVQKWLTIPDHGRFAFDCQMLTVGETGQQLVTYCAEQGSPVRDALRQYADGNLSLTPERVRYGMPHES